jgi:hypothetical protein
MLVNVDGNVCKCNIKMYIFKIKKMYTNVKKC